MNVKNLLPIHFCSFFGDIQMLLTDKHMLVSSAVSTPIIPSFVRVEHGEIRRKDIRDINPKTIGIYT